MSALFINVEVDAAVAEDPKIVAKLVEVCPVDIFAADDDGGLRLVEANFDECVLCRLCLVALDQEGGPDGGVRVIRLYEDDPEQAVLR
ncbi:MAG TPA: ferredoxin family protein [Solirubrobacteraceae bacterium]|nr:ferredoxin family protein [Solirubrobacteraceae bacterium]